MVDLPFSSISLFRSLKAILSVYARQSLQVHSTIPLYTHSEPQMAIHAPVPISELQAPGI